MYQRIQNEILKERVGLKIHPFRLVTIVQWWQQSLSSGSELWLCLGIFLGACDYCDYSDCSVVTLTPHRRLFYIKFREIMSSRMSASRALRSLQSQRLAELIEKSDVRHNIKNVTSHNTAPSPPRLLSHNITIRVKFITGTQWRLPLNINTSTPAPLPYPQSSPLTVAPFYNLTASTHSQWQAL